MKYNSAHKFFAIFTMIAFCQMLVLKSVHHHTALIPISDIICSLDGQDFTHPETHHHSSILPQFTDADDCPLCQFSISKLISPTTYASYFVLNKVSKLYTTAAFNIQLGCFALVSLRAPPTLL